jgi:hypothetical protein
VAGADFDHEARMCEPIVYISDLWHIEKHELMLNETVTTLPMYVSYQALGPRGFDFHVLMEDMLRQPKSWLDVFVNHIWTWVKTVVLSTNRWLLAFTFMFVILHWIFDFLTWKNGMPCRKVALRCNVAFKKMRFTSAVQRKPCPYSSSAQRLHAEIQFWHTRNSVEGLSLYSFFIDLFCQTVIVLHLLFDNDTSWAVCIRRVKRRETGLIIRLYQRDQYAYYCLT